MDSGDNNKMKPEFIIHFCPRDHVWLVAQKSARRNYFYKTIAECFTEESAEILYRELMRNG